MQPPPPDAPDTPGIPRRHPDDGWQLAAPLALRPASRRRLVAFADAIMPPKPREPGTLEQVVTHVQVSLRYMPRASVRLILLELLLLDCSPLWRLRGLRPLSSRPVDVVRQHLREIMASRWLPVRLLTLAPRALILSTYFDQDVAHRGIGYEPTAFIQSRIELRRRWTRGQEPEGTHEIRHPRQARR